MSDQAAQSEPQDTQPPDETVERFPAFESPYLHAPERARTIFLVTFGAACGPLLAGIILFGWRAAVIAAISIASCAVIERGYFFVTRTPALLGRSHAYLSGLLLALTLPPYVPWYVPVVAAAFAIIVGKGIFGGVGHFIWQPALVGRLAVAVMLPTIMTTAEAKYQATAPILAQDRLLVGDIQNARYIPQMRQWRGRPSEPGTDAFLVKKPEVTLKALTSGPPAYSALAYRPDGLPRAKPAVLMRLPSINDLICGVRPGGIGETCVVVIIVAGLYLVYRNYVKLHLPLVFIISAGVVAAVAPVRFVGLHDTVQTVWYPLVREGLDTGFIYVSYQLITGELFLAAFFLATEMTSRPVTSGGQVIFALCGGSLAMLLKLYVDTPIPAYMAVLAVNTMTLTIDAVWRPRVLGQKRLAFLRRRRV